ncbi:MAG: inorganic phosphate transporter [Ignavibacteriae bacterium]|nr:inorganic phosphate transporter [Ignavibacteria bacterium]MBI3363721.1 inorganic phosphate transporter [Ignavibacteriota bacterium]
MLTLVIVVVFIALVFDFLNGFHDSANSIATVVSTRVLTPRKAVMWAAFFNLVAAFLFDVHIAKTLGKGLVDLNAVNEYVIMSGLLGAIAWNIITWFYGLPTSSSHALMGGYAGAAIAKAGFGVILFGGWVKTVIFIFVAPLIGMILGFALMLSLMWIFAKRPSAKVNQSFRKLQLLSAALYSLGHGTNDAQKTMGIITSLLLTAGILHSFEVPYWVILMSHFAIALGTLFGGWRIVKTMGQKITKLKPTGGFCAETAGGITLLVTAFAGIPVSTTHTITGAIMGVGATKRLSGVRWGVAGNIIIAWVLTIPASAIVGASAYLVISLFI